MSETPWDSGMQNERTRLAWQRTMLSGLICSLLVARLLAPLSLPLAVAIGLTAVLTTAVLGWYSIRRYVSNHAALHADDVIADARSHLVLTVLVLATGAGALVYVILQ